MRLSLLPLSLLLVLALASCTTTKTGSAPITASSGRVDSWRLPAVARLTIAEIDALRQDPQAPAKLRQQLTDGPSAKRIRAAHAVEKLGGIPELEKDLVVALRRDSDPVVRVFACRALAAMSTTDPDTLAALQEIYRHTDNEIVETYAAGAIVCHTNGKAQNELQHLLDRLDPRSLPPTAPNAANVFWERRWAAAYLIARLGPDGAPLLSNVERSTEVLLMPDWVERQLFLTLRELSR